jgi:hypothetical protein
MKLRVRVRMAMMRKVKKEIGNKEEMCQDFTYTKGLSATAAADRTTKNSVSPVVGSNV